MKKLLLVFILGIFLFGMVSAFNFSDSTNIKAYWEFEESTNAFYDYYGRINGTCQSAVTKQQDGINNYGYDFGTAGTTGCYLNNKELLNSMGTMTISAWFKLDVDTADYNTIAIDWSSSDKGWMLWIEADRKIRWNSGNGGTGENDLYSDAIQNDGNWHHVMVTRDGTNINIYVDGALNKTEANTNNGGTTANNLTLGYWAGATDHSFNGNLDEIMILNVSLNSTYASEIWNSGLGSFPSESNAPSGLFNVSETSDNDTATYPTNNDSVLHSTFFQSNVTLGSYIFSTNASGSYVNDTAVEMSGTSAWANVTKFLHYPKNTIVSWLIYGNNTETWTSTSILTYIIKNSLPLIVGSPSLNETSVYENESVKVSVEVSDEDGLTDIDSVIAELYVPSLSSYSGENTTPLNYTNYVGNPITPTSESQYGLESSSIYEDGVIHQWYRAWTSGVGSDMRIVYANSTNGVNFSNPVNITLDGTVKVGLLHFINGAYNVTGYPDNSYFLLMPNYINESTESAQDLIWFNSTNKINWQSMCGGGEVTTGGYKKNPAYYLETNNSGNIIKLEGLFEEGSGSFNIYYWNSTANNFCSGWTKGSNPFGDNGGNADIDYRNGEFIVHFGDMSISSSTMNISVWRGTALNSLSMMGKFIVKNNQNWITNGENINNHISNPDVVIIEDENPNFLAKYFLYFSGDDLYNGFAYDSLNRSFDESHFGTTSGGNQNLTLSQEGTTSTWSFNFNGTNTTGFYNLTDVWISDGDAVNYSTYSNLSFEVSEIGSPIVTLNSPADASTSTSSNLLFNFSVTDTNNITEVNFYLDGVLNQTNSSGTQGVYLYNLTLADGTHNWSVMATNNYSLSTNSSLRTLTVDTTPNIQFESPTQINYYNQTDSYILINVSVTETYFSFITFDIDGTKYNYTDSTRFINESFADGTHNYNVTVYTTTGKSNYTETRTITIGTVPPTINVSSPSGTQDYLYEGKNITLNTTITDANLDTVYYTYGNYSGLTNYNTSMDRIIYNLTTSTTTYYHELVISSSCKVGGVTNITVRNYNNDLGEPARAYNCTNSTGNYLIETYTGGTTYRPNLIVGAYTLIETGKSIINATSGVLSTKYFNYQPNVNSLTVYANNTYSLSSSELVSLDFRVSENSRTLNTSSYETKSETFLINVTANSSLTLVQLEYNGTLYEATKNGTVYSKTIDVPLGISNNSVRWEFNYAGTLFYSTYSYQNVSLLNFSICDGSLTDDFLNISFKDENNLSTISSSIPYSEFVYYLGSGSVNKTYNYVSITDAYTYRFCATPTTETLNVDSYLQYKQGTTYPQRIWNPSANVYTNNTTNEILYLLSTANGIYVTFQVLNSAQSTLSDVNVQINRTVSGEQYEVTSGSTDAAGLITVWLNPDFLHSFLFSKTGYSSYSASFYPTQSSYTIVLGASSSSSGGGSTPVSYTKGITYAISPTNLSLLNDTEYTFGFNLNSSYWDIDEFGFTLKLSNGTILSSATSSSVGSTITLDVNTENLTKIYMNYYWIIEGKTTSGTREWKIYNPELSQWSVKKSFDDLNNYLDSGFFGIDNFGRYLLIFLALFISVGIVGYKFGANSLSFITFITFAIVFFFDVGVGLIPAITVLGGSEVEYILTFLTGLIMVFTIINEGYRT